MAACKVSIAKKPAASAKVAGPKAVPAPGVLLLVDNQDDTVTVSGVDAAGFPVDISALASLAVASSDPAVCTAGNVAGLTFGVSAVKPGTCTVTITVTITDGSSGPFTVDLPLTVSAGPISGLVVTPGTPVSRP